MKKHVASWRAALLLELSSRLTLSIPLVVAMTFICNGLIAQDYSISTAGGALVITDNSNNADALTLSQSGGNIRFAVSPSTRTYSINGGATTAFSTPADVALASLTSITVNAAGGNDIINVGAFTANLPSLTINGGTGDETVNFNGDITFASNANLDVDLQDDDASPGKDALVVASNANLLLSGAGTATVRVSMMVTLNGGGSIETVNGDLTVEANQQATPTTGDFYGIFLSSGTLKTSGAGVLTAKGKGGTASFQYGIIAMNGAQILGGTAPVIVEGTGGPGAG
ncbi:MAG TPA: hypothetical protein PK858_12765, partial [Saprospiraceae bacterium]|nr:hypothetical protein [Saprospiraceae bacterium]